jgi:glycosyltransferase involved in cell wall biosynthesis
MAERISRISIVVPIYNEEKILHELTLRISDVIHKLPEFDWEVIYVDDGSADHTASVAEELSHHYDWLRVISLSRNFGHQIAITAGGDYATGDAVIFMDGDLQDPPEVIPQMIDFWRKGFDVITARRKRRNGESIFKLATAFLFYRTLRVLADTPIPVDTGDFRLMSRPVVDAVKNMPERSRFLRGMVSWAGFRQTEIEYERHERAEGKTKYTLMKMLRLAANGLLSFSRVPLQSITVLGLFFSGTSFIGLCAALFASLMLDSNVQNWIYFGTAFLFMGGVQLTCLGVIGSYVGRIFDEVRARPLYFVQRFTGIRSVEQKTIPFGITTADGQAAAHFRLKAN